MDEDRVTELKLAINQFIWEHGPPQMTLEAAEKAACDLLAAMVESERITSGLGAAAGKD